MRKAPIQIQPAIRRRRPTKGQSIIEYIIIVGVAMTALYVMAPALKRATQSIVKATADQMATQKNAEQDYSPGSSHMAKTVSSSMINSQKMVNETKDGVQTISTETSGAYTNTQTDAGISN